MNLSPSPVSSSSLPRRLPCFALALAIAIWPLLSAAEEPIFRTVDAQGNVTYSDQPPPARMDASALPAGADGSATERIDLGPANTFSAPRPAFEPRPVPTASETFTYENLAILSPQPQQTIRANDGSVDVRSHLAPNLQKGHRLRALLDGSQVGREVSAAFTLPNVPRGTHRLQLAVINEDGKVIKRSEAVTFHVRRFSIPQRQPRTN